MSRGRKLTREQKDSIVREFLAGALQTELAAKYGVSNVSIHLLLKRRNVPPRRMREKAPSTITAIRDALPMLSAAELRSVRQTATEILAEIGVE